MGKSIMSTLLGFFILIALDNVTAATFSSSRGAPYYSSFHINGDNHHLLYEHTPAGTTKSLRPHHFVSKERTLQDAGDQVTSSGDKREVEALLSFKKAIT